MEPQISICKEDAAPARTTTPPTNTSVTVIDIDTQIWSNKASNESEGTPSQSGLPTIPKVPATLKNSQGQKLPRWIEPSVVSIGPYYYKHTNLQKAQELKSLHAAKFIEMSGQNKDDLYLKIKKETPELKKCYDNREISKHEYEDNQLATMFSLDGCFLLHFIYYRTEEYGFSHLGFTNHEIAYIEQDLFLLENQLPYRVLELLFEGGNFPKRSMEDRSMEDWSMEDWPMKDRIKHFVASHVPSPRKILVKVNRKPCHLLDYLRGAILGKRGITSPQQEAGRRPSGPKWHLCNVQELKKMGIHFKPSPTSYLTDISFKSHFCTSGCLKLPTIFMNTSTMIIFLNLIAFESSNTTNNLGVSSYLCFLDSLIDRWDDVKELQAAGILHNFVGEQREVAQFFNNVCSKLVRHPYAYHNVMLGIERHVERHNNARWRRNYIQFKQKYFGSPWSLIALFGAIIGLSLTAIQAFKSLFP